MDSEARRRPDRSLLAHARRRPRRGVARRHAARGRGAARGRVRNAPPRAGAPPAPAGRSAHLQGPRARDLDRGLARALLVRRALPPGDDLEGLRPPRRGRRSHRRPVPLHVGILVPPVLPPRSARPVRRGRRRRRRPGMGRRARLAPAEARHPRRRAHGRDVRRRVADGPRPPEPRPRPRERRRAIPPERGRRARGAGQDAPSPGVLDHDVSRRARLRLRLRRGVGGDPPRAGRRAVDRGDEPHVHGRALGRHVRDVRRRGGRLRVARRRLQRQLLGRPARRRVPDEPRRDGRRAGAARGRTSASRGIRARPTR